jgi:hypothetical protein
MEPNRNASAAVSVFERKYDGTCLLAGCEPACVATDEEVISESGDRKNRTSLQADAVSHFTPTRVRATNRTSPRQCKTRWNGPQSAVHPKNALSVCWRSGLQL